ncbi:patatin-like phospholipase family protein [Streptacidiphilus sp. PB12-B1b]|uniref:patatin-like phospholipase family protein n=1 Tax=Streptacidiphilus sp. PB12-B1b TaxID=2705012 RepID=UPI0015F9A299|nr:patatin-like phospholipase family protein [Streptacidiphilus sp. PB12-B1b]QMU75660.1 patatin-like phospholipase family protein [Streptacidiphilus sp. PB12-B1b]
MSGESALVLGGGGLAGIAWTTGVLAGLAEAGADATGADFLLGTSAGATVAAQIGSGLPIAELYRRQVEPELQCAELTPSSEAVAAVMEQMVLLATTVADPLERRRRMGALGLAADTVPEAARRAVIAGRLPVHDWPGRRLAVTAVQADSGEARVFDREAGVALVDAVAASCAVPGIWPPVTIGGARYVDGGARSGSNADLAAGYARVLVIAPWSDPALDAEVAALAASGRVELIVPDEGALAAFGADPLAPGTRTPAGREGRRQGLAAAGRIAPLFPAEAG